MTPYALGLDPKLGGSLLDAQAFTSCPTSSALDLNTDSLLTMRFSRDQRDVMLARGLDRRPFAVVAGDITVRADGARFSVRRIRGDTVSVNVAEGNIVPSRLARAASAFTVRSGTVCSRLSSRRSTPTGNLAAPAGKSNSGPSATRFVVSIPESTCRPVA